MSATRDRVEAALNDAFREGGEMVTKWALVAEVIDEDGVRGVWTLAPSSTPAWDTLGLLTYAQQLEQASAVQEAFEGD